MTLDEKQIEACLGQTSDPNWKDVAEAASRRYGPSAMVILPLESGRLAVLGFQRKLVAICDTIAECQLAHETIDLVRWQRNEAKRMEARREEQRLNPPSEKAQADELSKLLDL